MNEDKAATASGRERRKLVVTNSEVGNFRSCRMRWWFSYHQRLRPMRRPQPLAVGSCVHLGLGEMYVYIRQLQLAGVMPGSVDELTTRATEAMQGGLKEYLATLYKEVGSSYDPERIEELIAESSTAEAEAQSTVERYVARFGMSDAERYKVLAVELAHRVPLRDAHGRRTPRVTGAGVFDLVLWDPAVGDVVLTEHKTARGDPREAESKLDMDPQTTGYVWKMTEALHDSRLGVFDLNQDSDTGVWRFVKPRADGRVATGRVFYNVVRKTGPRKPDITKAGLVSAAQIDTRRDVYEEALRVQEEVGYAGVDRKGQSVEPKPTPRNAKQIERLEGLPTDDSKWVMRHETWHSASDQARWLADEVGDAKLIRRALATHARDPLPITRNPSNCNMPWSPPCAYRELCIQDSDLARKDGYRVVPDPHMEVVEAEGSGEL